jgi:hypothetical protein
VKEIKERGREGEREIINELDISEQKGERERGERE